MQDMSQKTALILSGGGARAAYQVGVLKGISTLMREGASSPFRILCGTSAGAINAAALAISAGRFHEGVRRLVAVWGNFHVEQVFRADARGTFKSGGRWLGAMFLGGLGKFNPMFLLDRRPLFELMKSHLPMEQIQASIDAGHLDAISITASGYTSGASISFFQGVDELLPWQRARRIGQRAQLTIDHLMASSAIPFIFSAIKLEHEFFGDGSMRQMSPISPAIHLGAERVMVIGVRPQNGLAHYQEPAEYPSLAQIAGHVLNTVFTDNLEMDLERLQRINDIVGAMPRAAQALPWRPIDTLVVAPSRDPAEIAMRHRDALPRPVRLLFRGVGVHNNEGADLLSFLLFEKAFCRELIDLGYRDTLARRDEICDFLSLNPTPVLASETAVG